LPIDRAFDIAIIGAGAAGLMAAIWAGREARARGLPLSIVALDGARKLGAKILVAGGGRCNVTHHAVDESSYSGSTRPAIRKVLRAFDVPATVAFFRELKVELKREETGKLFPVTDDAHTVLNALVGECVSVGAALWHPWRVDALARAGDLFEITRRPPAPGEVAPLLERPGVVRARRVILATGGMALPKSGSDGAGYAFARAMGHSVTPLVYPALVPLLLPEGHPLRGLSGIATPVTLTVKSSAGKHMAQVDGPLLCTHFGLSGPAPLDISRHLHAARVADRAATLVVNWLPGWTPDRLDAALAGLRGVAIGRWVMQQGLPERLARALVERAGVDPASGAEHLPKDRRRTLVSTLTALPLPVTGDRGFTYAEVTAGGVPLSEIHLHTMESRVCPGLHVIGEICDVDGRIGGFNFQWAWASGYLAGKAAGATLPEAEPASPDAAQPKN
jgi:predicted Rossmann fold flavoprotein